MKRANRNSPAEFLAGVHVLALRELSSSFDSGLALIAAGAFALLANAIFMNEFFLAGRAEMSAWFERMPLLLALFLPAVSMRQWAEERKQRTLELLLTLPIQPGQAILAKFLAALGQLCLFLGASLPILVMLLCLGQPDLGRIAASYLGVFLLGALFLALGQLLSALTGDQIVAFVTSTLVCFTLVLLGEERVVAVLDGLAPALGAGSFLRSTISVAPHFEAFLRGAIELSGLVYFGGLCAAALWICARVLDEQRA